MHYAVVRDAAFGWHREICRVQPGKAACSKRRPAGGSKIMSIKRILVPLPGSVDQTGEIDMALSAAKALGAHVEALFISQPPPPVTRGGVSVRNGLWAKNGGRRTDKLVRRATGQNCARCA
jgi:hypothetical protein